MIQSILRPLHKALIITMTLVIGLHLSPLVALAGVDALKPYHHVKTIDRANIRLSDLFPRLGSVPDQTIGLAPAPGQDMTLNARTLMRLASAYGIDWRPQTTADQVSIPFFRAVSPDAIYSMLKQSFNYSVDYFLKQYILAGRIEQVVYINNRDVYKSKLFLDMDGVFVFP